MKKQLRAIAFAAAALVAGQAFAEISNVAEGYSLTQDWAVPTTLSKAETRFVTANKVTKQIVAVQKAEKKIYTFDANGMSLLYDLSACDDVVNLAPGLTSDEAGNIILLSGWSGTDNNTIVILPAGGTVDDRIVLDLGLPAGVQGRCDQMGRVLGNVMSDEGGLILSCANNATAVAGAIVKNGTVDPADVADGYGFGINGAKGGTITAVQPYYATFEEQLAECDDDMYTIATAAYVYQHNAPMYVYNPAGDPDSYYVSVARFQGANKNDWGFDWFELGGKRYFVQGDGDAHWADGFVIFDEEKNVYAKFAGTTKDSSTYQSIIAYAREDGKTVDIYQYYCTNEARHFVFTAPGEDTPAAPELYILGLGNGDAQNWDPANPDTFTYDEANGVYTFDVTGAPYGFKISTAKGDWAAFDAAGFHVDGDLKANVVATLVAGAPANGVNIKPENCEAPYTLEVNLDAMTILVKGKALGTPETCYLIGGIKGANWDPANGVALTESSENAGVFSCTAEMQSGWFSFCEKQDADWDKVGLRWGAETDGYEIGKEVAAKLYVGKNAFNYTGGTEEEWAKGSLELQFTVDFNAMTVVVKQLTSGVESVAIDNAVVEYFNLQGIRVNNPENGVFIRRQGNNVTKVIL